jgi:hypothetical protein
MREKVTSGPVLSPETEIVASQHQVPVGEKADADLGMYLAATQQSELDALPPLIQFVRGRVLPDIDINDNSSLLAILEDKRPI